MSVLSRAITGGIGAVVAVLLLVLGTSLVVREVQVLAASEVLRATDDRNSKLTTEQLRRAVEIYEGSDLARSDLLFNRLHTRVVFTQKRARSAGQSELLDREQQGVVQASKDLLTAAPAKALGWCTLAHATLSLKGVNAAWQQALELCYATARREPGVLFRRIRIGLQIWPVLDDEQQRRVRNDLVMLLSSPGLENSAARILAHMVATVAPQRARMVRGLIATFQPDQTGRFDRVLAAAIPSEGDR
jgi:hypothetical protein